MYMCIRNKFIPALILFLFLNNLAFALHPRDETPTDKSVWAKIDKANFKLEEDEVVKIFIEAEGRASPNTNHCGVAFVVVYKNGSTNYDGVFLRGPINIENTDTLIFEPLEKNWTKWILYILIHAEKEKIGLSKEELKNISSFELWIRAYADEMEEFWNQSYVDLTKVVVEEMEEFYGKGGNQNIKEEKQGNKWLFLAIIAIVAIVIIGIGIYKLRG